MERWIAAQTFRAAPAGQPDLYRTPRGAIEPLLDVEPLEELVWEPACGDGALARVLKARGHQVIASDLHDHGYGVTGVDFLEPIPTALAGANVIMTNPPFTRNGVERFAARGLELAEKVVLFGRLAFLESARRYAFFQRCPPRRIWVFSNRVPMTSRSMEATRANCRAVPFAWYVWERGFIEQPELGWLRYEEQGYG